MRISRGSILIILGVLTACFLGASYALWFDFNPALIPSVIGGSPTPKTSDSPNGVQNGIESVWLSVNQGGIVSISAKDLSEAGLNFPILSPEFLDLTHNGQEIPYIVHGEEENAVAYFFAEYVKDPRQPLPIYQMHLGSGKPMAYEDAKPEGESSKTALLEHSWEENRYFVQQAVDGDPWMGPLLQAPDSWNYTLKDIHPNGGPAFLTLELFSQTEKSGSPDHHVEIQVNGQTIDHYLWDGIRHETIQTPIDNGILLPEGENIISILVHDDSGSYGETIYINSLLLEYEGEISTSQGQVSFISKSKNIRIVDVEEDLMVFDITNPDQPIYLTNLIETRGDFLLDTEGNDRHFIASEQSQTINPTIQAIPHWPNSLLEDGWGADYIAIIADVIGFEDAIEPLLALRQEQGLRVVAVPLLQIFDEFGDGSRDPQAIKSFLEFASKHWKQPAPRYVLLVGDATYDISDQISGKNRNRLPSLLVHTDTSGYIVSDNLFTHFNETQSPISIGRLPAQNAPQLRTMVEKTLVYEQELQSKDNSWKTRALLVADDEPEFDKSTLNVAEMLSGEGFHVYRLQMSQGENIHNNILSAFNQGVGFINFVGYGNQYTWGDEAVLQNSDAQALQNSSRLPILTAFSSRNGAFAEPHTDSLAEALIRSNNGGVVAAVAPSGIINAEQQASLAEIFYDHLLSVEESSIGGALSQMFIDSSINDDLKDALISINLLGDPALSISIP